MKNNLQQFKCRCSAIGQIMTEPRSKSEPLSKTCITYVETWVKEQLYNKRHEFSSKYTEKGLAVEADSIEFLARMLNLGMVFKNEACGTNEWLTGTPDIVLPDEVIDVKNSWECFTFPLFDTSIPDKKYYWQLQGYMDLFNKSRARLVYTLQDTPDHIIESELSRMQYKMGVEEINTDMYDEFFGQMKYAFVPDKFRIKTFAIERNQFDIDRIHERVEECRHLVESMMRRIMP